MAGETVQMSARELAFYRAGRAVGRADAFGEVANHLEQNANPQAAEQAARDIAAWMQALARDVAQLRLVSRQRGRQNRANELAAAIVRAVPLVTRPHEECRQFLRGTAAAFAAKAGQAKGQFVIALAAAEAIKPAGNVAKRFARALMAELAKI